MKVQHISTFARRISPAKEQFFFGYYDLQPYHENGQLHLAHRAPFAGRLQQKGDAVQVGLIDCRSGMFHVLDETQAWNFQQGAMLQWDPRQPDTVLYNTDYDGGYRTMRRNIKTGQVQYLERPIANVSADGTYALSINFSRLYDFRPGYGYAGRPDRFYYQNHSAEDGVWRLDLHSGESRRILSLAEIWEFSKDYFQGQDEKIVINHITFAPGAQRFVMLVRNFPRQGERHKTALITADREGKDLYLLSGYGVQSHYFWLDADHLIVFSDGKELSCCAGWANTYILTDKAKEGRLLADGFFSEDHHMSFSPDRMKMLTDTYQDSHNFRRLRLYEPQRDICTELGRFYSPPTANTDIRCDLHPRWNRRGDGITFDSTHEGYRGIYSISLA